MFRYPPFFRLIYVYVRHRDERTTDSAAQTFASMLQKRFGNRVLGPDKPAIGRVKMQYIRKMVIKIETNFNLALARHHWRETQAALMSDKRWATVQVYFDVDPQ